SVPRDHCFLGNTGGGVLQPPPGGGEAPRGREAQHAGKGAGVPPDAGRGVSGEARGKEARAPGPAAQAVASA
ncbi:MAG: hypothetical protein DIU69_13305, partial [Bacillota bacterium]